MPGWQSCSQHETTTGCTGRANSLIPLNERRNVRCRSLLLEIQRDVVRATLASGGKMIVTLATRCRRQNGSRVWFCRGLDVVARVQGPWLKLPRSTAVESNLTLLYPAESCCYDNPQCQPCEITPRYSTELRYFCVLRQQMQRSGVRWRVKKT